MASMKREKCYHFLKLTRLRASTQFFPEANEIDPINGSASNINKTSNLNNNSSSTNRTSQTVLAPFEGPIIHLYHQRQLIDMTRYRNILRFQLGIRSVDQPLVAIDNTTRMSHKNITTLSNH